jgi:prephenate dehydratase
MTGPVAFQGWQGAYSDMACRAAFPDRPTLPCETFEATIEAVISGRATYAMLPCENSLVGRVPDIHALLPDSGLCIVGEHFQRIEHCLLGVPGARVSDVRHVHSHPVALGQVRGLLRELGATAVVQADTAGAAEMVAGWGRIEDAAVASALAADIHGLMVLRSNVEDAAHNTTRFYITAAKAAEYDPGDAGLMTTFLFAVRNVPAALYKALGGFATNGVNMTKLESYMVGGAFTATEFMCDVEGHPEQPALRLALEELGFFSRRIRILGVYPKAKNWGGCAIPPKPPVPY